MKRRTLQPLLLALPLAVLLPSVALARDLTFEDRVNCQEAIERVYYSHQIGATKPFEEAVPREVLENKVRTYLKESVALAEFWKTPVTADMLRAEMDRMARQTQMPARLRELHAVLGSDAFLFQECVARPSLVSRLAHNFFSGDERIQGDARREAEELQRRLLSGKINPRTDHPRREVSEVVLGREGGKKLVAPEYSRPLAVPSPLERLELQPSEFQKWRAAAPRSVGSIGVIEEDEDAFVIRATLSENAEQAEVATYSIPKVRWDAWWERVEAGFNEFDVGRVSIAGAVRSLAGPTAFESLVSKAAGCLPDDTWNNGSLGDAPEAVTSPVAVWTGSIMVVFGVDHRYGGHLRVQRYDPSTDTWSQGSTAGIPSALSGYAWPVQWVWTGREAILWGNGSGGQYNPVSDEWTPIAEDNVPIRSGHTAIWTGETMIVWGGVTCEGISCRESNTGERYDPRSGIWRSISTTDAPSARYSHAAIWTGTRMLVWGGEGKAHKPTVTGGIYNPVSDSWASISSPNTPEPALSWGPPVAVWTGSLVLVWWSYYNLEDGYAYGAGHRYDPVTDTWTPMSKTSAPEPYEEMSGIYAGVWTGSLMLVWGADDDGFHPLGGRYNPVTDTWAPISMVNAPWGRASSSVVWTGNLMVVWGGIWFDGYTIFFNTGGRYDPVSDTWTPTSTGTVPFVANRSNLVWTGNSILTWGQQNAARGGRYDPVLDSWTPITLEGAPGNGGYLVWTGSVMIVWGDRYKCLPSGCSSSKSGGRYDPVSDTWGTISTTNAPPGLGTVAATWTGRAMVVWGGEICSASNCHFTNTGGRYDPDTDTWNPTSTTDAPSGRFYGVKAIWTGSIMVVYGVKESCIAFRCNYSAAGGRYDPVSDIWSPISTANAPSSCGEAPRIWTGSEMILWGCGWTGAGIGIAGGRYDPGSDTWTPTSTIDAPSALLGNTAVWTGTEMVIWGGLFGDDATNSGARYDPVSDTWRPTSTDNAPSPRFGHSAVWIDSGMVIWGGDNASYDTNYPALRTGGRYVVNYSPDADNDGVTVCAGDCNDADPAVHPGAVETCNAIDDNCDGTTDEGFNVDSACSIVLDECHQLAGAEACLPDGSGTICQGTVVPHDLTPPQLSVSVSPDILWPPDHRMVGVEASVTATDACGSPAVTLTSVSSSEPDDASGRAAGKNSGDIQGARIGTADFDFQLRSERDGGGDGRIYRVTYTAIDASGNQATAHAFVRVPHDTGVATGPVPVSAQDGSAGTVTKGDGVPGDSSCEVIRGKAGSPPGAGTKPRVTTGGAREQVAKPPPCP